MLTYLCAQLKPIADTYVRKAVGNGRQVTTWKQSNNGHQSQKLCVCERELLYTLHCASKIRSIDKDTNFAWPNKGTLHAWNSWIQVPLFPKLPSNFVCIVLCTLNLCSTQGNNQHSTTKQLGLNENFSSLGSDLTVNRDNYTHLMTPCQLVMPSKLDC